MQKVRIYCSSDDPGASRETLEGAAKLLMDRVQALGIFVAVQARLTTLRNNVQQVTITIQGGSPEQIQVVLDMLKALRLSHTRTDGLADPASRTAEPGAPAVRPIVVYLSHADTEEERALRGQFAAVVKPLIKQNRIRVRHRDSVDPGEDPQLLIPRLVAGSDLFIPFLCQSYLGDDVVNDLELPAALQGRQRGTLQIWPLRTDAMSDLPGHPVESITGLVGFPRAAHLTLAALRRQSLLGEELANLVKELDLQIAAVTQADRTRSPRRDT